MGVNKLRPQIQLSLREYIDVWSGIAFEHYQQAVSDEVLFDALSALPGMDSAGLVAALEATAPDALGAVIWRRPVARLQHPRG